MPITLFGPIFAERGHGEFLHTRRLRKSDPRAGRTPVSCMSDCGRHRSVQWNSEESWCVRREPFQRGECVFTYAASLGKDRVLLAASVASLTWEPSGPAWCCLVAQAPRRLQLRLRFQSSRQLSEESRLRFARLSQRCDDKRWLRQRKQALP